MFRADDIDDYELDNDDVVIHEENKDENDEDLKNIEEYFKRGVDGDDEDLDYSEYDIMEIIDRENNGRF